MRASFGASFDANSKVVLTTKAITDFFTLVSKVHDANLTTRRVNAFWLSDMAAAFMAVVKPLATAEAKNVGILASAVNTPALQSVEYPIKAVYVQAFVRMFSDALQDWHTTPPDVREAFFGAYSELLTVTTSTTKEYFDFVMHGAKCFDRNFFPEAAKLDTICYDDRRAACIKQLTEQFKSA